MDAVFLLHLLVGTAFTLAHGSLPVVYPEESWPHCIIGESIRGTCENLVECGQAVEAVYRGLHPPICYWQRHFTFPLVCCPAQGSLDAVLTPPPKPIPPHRINHPQNCGIVDFGKNRQFDGEADRQHLSQIREQHWPWMVSVYNDSRGINQIGSGFLIDDRHILSAARNFPLATDKSHWSVRLQRTRRQNFDAPGAVYTVSQVKVHEGFRNWVRYDDLALVTLAEPIPNTSPLCLPPKDLDPAGMAGVNATVLGWQRTESVPVVSSSWCSEVYNKFLPLSYPRGIGEEFFCAGLQLNEQPNAPGVDDIGGPVMIKTADGAWMAMGLVSLDYKCAQQGMPGVYLNLAPYVDWINAQRNQQTSEI